MDRNVHRRPGYAFALSRSSARISKYEYMSGENLMPWFQGDGAYYLAAAIDTTHAEMELREDNNVHVSGLVGVGHSSDLVVTVRNAGQKTIPNIAMTVNGLDRRKTDPDLADPNRPVFALNGVQVEIAGFPEAKDASPRGCDTAYVNTWACGPLKPAPSGSFSGTISDEAPDVRVADDGKSIVNGTR